MPAPAAILDAIRREQPQGVAIERVPPGAAGAQVTAQRMAELAVQGAHSLPIVTLTREVVRGLDSHDYEGEARALYDWVKEHVRYTQDPRGLEWVQTPAWTAWILGQGDCDDHALLLSSMATSINLGSAFRMVATDPRRPQEPSHVYALLGWRERGGTRWVAVDTTQDEHFGWEPPPERVLATWDFVVAQP